MNFSADDPLSPIFLVLLAGVLLDVVFAWSGIVRGQLPAMRTSVRGARIAGGLAALSAVFLVISYRYFLEYTEAYGTVALAIAFALFVGGIMLAERIPD